MSHPTAELQHFEPGAFIRIDDVMTGARKLARVTDAGCTYLDLDTDDCTSLPIYATLLPEEAGNILGWGLSLVDQAPEMQPAWQALCERLTNAGEGVLTYNRSAHWVFMNRNFDVEQALAAGRAETARIAKGRRTLDEMLKNSAGAR